MPPNEFLEEESFFRGVHSHQFDHEAGRLTSAAFKDSQGASVDRNWTRTDKECVDKLLEKKDFPIIVKVSYTSITDCNCLPVYCPIEENEFHSEIHSEEGVPTLTKSKARCLSTSAEIVYNKVV
ncbi:hypothetical protein MUK70_10950 [Dyadobacter chenwenxiniae]|uniref:Uncharacterized protein n=1 Tax=Dyadobacter chenwenxiniae TaxID=2906456 RepID=A0A9X1THY2_9BACT|nr:hypothetical protein [Dyadobacter chenwenxiniae]MCF0065592.1 hypothetical protein [Dyadobacter chenwenxiniae]UON85503.1 hypothetical protein MUK70_10950 [Dyadobacter chenwenxiniae]